MQEKVLQEFGLNDKEAKIYLALLKEKSSTASRLAKKTKLNRTTAYLELDNLLNLHSVLLKKESIAVTWKSLPIFRTAW